MSCSKPLPSFTFDLLCYLNRDQLERFLIVCRPLKNFIDRYFYSKPYRVFDYLSICGGSYALSMPYLHWHPNQDESSGPPFSAVQQILYGIEYYSFAEVRPYLDQTVRIKETTIYVAGYSIYNPEHIAEMESIAYLWRDAKICIENASDGSIDRIVAEDFQPILNSPIILQCRILYMNNAHFSFKDYKILYTVKVIELGYEENYHQVENVDPNSWLQFLVQPGMKPVVVLLQLKGEVCDDVIDIFYKDFSSAVSPNAFKIAFNLYWNNPYWGEELTEFRETNIISGEILELKKGLPVECQNESYAKYPNYYANYTNYTLERSSF